MPTPSALSGSSRFVSDKGVALTESDRAWLSRLPEPDQVTFNDAVELAWLARQVEPRTADTPLVHRIWAPVKTRHDMTAAAHEVDAARQPWPDVPRSVVPEALVGAIEATTELTDAEGRNRADLMLDAGLTVRSCRHFGLVDDARKVLEDVENRRAERESLTAVS